MKLIRTKIVQETTYVDTNDFDEALEEINAGSTTIEQETIEAFDWESE